MMIARVFRFQHFYEHLTQRNNEVNYRRIRNNVKITYEWAKPDPKYNKSIVIVGHSFRCSSLLFLDKYFYLFS